jgi:GNAT superfamily N-acetyltransferase
MLPDGFTISDDKSRLDVDMIHRFLTEESYWAQTRTRTQLETALKHAHCFGLYTGDGAQVGFVRVVTDYSVFAYLADVFILREYRGRGLAKAMLTVVFEHPDLKPVRRWMLITRDAQELYRQFGFTHPEVPERIMGKLTRP